MFERDNFPDTEVDKLREEMKRLRDGHRTIVTALKSEVANLKEKLRDSEFHIVELLDALRGE